VKPMFLDELNVKIVDDGYQLTHPMKYARGLEVYEVPAGFVTNFASVPRIVRPFITGHGKDRYAATLHDYLYSVKHDRKEADAIFLEALEVCRVGFFTRHAMHAAVRLAGWAFH